MKDTLRILVDWECNLNCPYCCNNIPRFREQIRPAELGDLVFSDYKTICISGGEPLLHMPKVLKVLNRCMKSNLVVLYTNGLLLSPVTAKLLDTAGVDAINVGLHVSLSFESLIKRITAATSGTALSVRFHAQDLYQKALTEAFPTTSFRFWKMDDCDRGNEDRVVLK
jgi:molybdenum cofactor biosynthesis enzyme MoaA